MGDGEGGEEVADGVPEFPTATPRHSGFQRESDRGLSSVVIMMS